MVKEKKGRNLAKRWFIDAFSGMALGLFATLLIGLIIKQVGLLIGKNVIGNFLYNTGVIAGALMGAGIGVGIARALKADKLVLFSCIIAGFMGAHANQIISGTFVDGVSLTTVGCGEPIGAYVATIFACEIGLLVQGKTKIDIIVVPLTVILTSLLVVLFICPYVIWLLDVISKGIKLATELQPLLMGVVISVVVGVLLTLPTSSAAICIALHLGGIAGGAAVVGCCCQMLGFAVMSYRENKFAGLIAQGIGTSMLQIPNIFVKPILMLPPVIASIIVGPLATCVFHLQCNFLGSGMGTSGFVGIIATITETAGTIPNSQLIVGIILLCFVIPIVVPYIISEIMRKRGIIKFGDLALNL